MSTATSVSQGDMRWQLILTLYHARPLGAFEELLLSVVRCTFADSTPAEIRRELAFLETSGLVCVERRPDNRWHADLARKGIDLAEYTSEGQPGIARPKKYW